MRTLKTFLPLILVVTFAIVATLNLAQHTIDAKKGISAYLLR